MCPMKDSTNDLSFRTKQLKESEGKFWPGTTVISGWLALAPFLSWISAVQFKAFCWRLLYPSQMEDWLGFGGGKWTEQNAIWRSFTCQNDYYPFKTNKCNSTIPNRIETKKTCLMFEITKLVEDRFRMVPPHSLCITEVALWPSCRLFHPFSCPGSMCSWMNQ